MTSSAHHSTDDADRRQINAAWAQFNQIADGGKLKDYGSRLAISGYRIVSEIHRGGQGVVYQAIQESTRRKIAIKVLKQGPFADRVELARFEREVDVLSRLNHPHIVAIHDRGLTNGHAYYVMDYIPGHALDAYVAGAELDTNEILTLFAKICDAVNVAHLRGVIHRDLKPGNIRVDAEGEPRILDFGLAKLEQEVAGGSSAQGMTMTGQFVGSLPWASPEQAEGDADHLDIRTDVYSLGVILYQLLTTRFPYPVTGRINDVVRHITQSSPARPTSTSRRIDHDLELIVLKCLSKEPDQRYQSAGALAADIRHFLANEPVIATSPSTTYRIRKFVQRNKGLVFAAGAIAATLFIATGVSIAFGISEAKQRKTTQRALTRAEHAELEAKAKADELEKVASFQQAQLAGIDARLMGVRIREDLLEKARSAAANSKLTPDDASARVAELEKSIAGADFTGMALDALDANFFNPALDAIEKQFADQPLIKAQLLQTIASTLQEVGLLDAAGKPQEAALDIRRKQLGDEHPDTLNSISEMGLLLHAQGKLAEAEPYYREALEKRRRVLGEESPETLSSIHNMGGLMQALNKLSEAQTYYNEALEKRRRILGEEHRDTLTSMSSVGYLLTAMGKWDEAEPLYREVLEKRRRVLGDEDPDTLFSINNLGALYQTQRKFDQAAPLYEESIEKRRRVLGDDHPDTLQAINNMATLLYSQRKFAEAEPYYREALDKRRKVLGSTHPNTLNTLSGMGALLSVTHRYQEAEPYTREALEIRRCVLPPDHPDILNSVNNMAQLLHKLGNAAEAERLYRESFEGHRRVMGEDHPLAFMSLINLCTFLREHNRPAEAIELMIAAEPAARRKFIGPGAPRLGRFLIDLGRYRVDANQFAAAEKNLLEAQKILSAPGVGPQWDAEDAPKELVRLYEAWQTAEPDKRHDADAAKWRTAPELSATSQPS